MNKAIELAKEIQRKQKAIQETKSDKLKRDYTKSVARSIRDLKYYCKVKKLNYIQLSDEFINKLP